MRIPEAILSRVAFIAIREFAAASYAYEVHSAPFVSDGEFDQLCAWLKANYAWVKPFDTNDYLDEGSLVAGTGMRAAKKVVGQTREYAEFCMGLRKTSSGGLCIGAEIGSSAKQSKKKKDRAIEDLLG